METGVYKLSTLLSELSATKLPLHMAYQLTVSI